VIGTSLSHFRITAKLGEGGMGEVYRAEDTRLGREVAVKVLPQAFVADAERLARFEREARVLASLSHSNIAAIHEVGEQDGTHFLVMELAAGDTLADRIAAGPLPLEKALGIALQIAEALAAAHERGVVHRDLKPANVIVGSGGAVKILDFGLAKAFAPEAAAGGPPLNESPTLTAQMTQAGTLLGTAAYMSPEQARGDEVDKRADIWAFGCVLLEMLSGERAFQGRTATDTIASVLAREPRWESLPTRTPPAVERILRRCLEKEVGRRLHDIADARIELEEVLAGGTRFQGRVEKDPRETLRGRGWTAAAVIASLVALALGGVAWRSARVESPVVQALVLPPGTGSFSLEPARPGPVAVSPDGRRLVFAANAGDGIDQLWVRGIDQLTARPLAGTRDGAYPFWSPDSRFIAFFIEGRLKKVAADGGPALIIAEASNGKGGTWNHDGVILFAPSHNGPIVRVSAAGGTATPVTEVDREAGENSHRHPRFLPDGERFLFVARRGDSAGHALMLGSLSGGEPREVMRSASQAEVAGGYLWFVREDTLMAAPFDPERLTERPQALAVVEDVSSAPEAAIGYFSVSGSGVLAYHLGGAPVSSSTLSWHDRQGGLLSQVGSPEPQTGLELAPDGTRAVVQVIDSSGNGDLWIYDLERQVKGRFTFDSADDGFPVWSPSGDLILFASRRSGESLMWVKPVDGGGTAELLRPGDLASWGPGITAIWPEDWSPDGRYVVYTAVDELSVGNLWALDLTGNGEPIPIQHSPFFEAQAAVSPDGRWLAYGSFDTGRYEVYVTAFPHARGKWQVSSSGGGWPRWSPQGDELFFLALDGTLRSVEVTARGDTVTIGESRALFQTHIRGGFKPGYGVGPDGERFLINARGEQAAAPPLALMVGWPEVLRRRR
jgi:eukaryotic-like serine/threonine-protein kinase